MKDQTRNLNPTPAARVAMIIWVGPGISASMLDIARSALGRDGVDD